MEIKGDLATLLLGADALVEQCKIAIHQPKISEICISGEDDFLIAVQLLSHMDLTVKTIKEGNSQLSAFPDFQLFMTMVNDDLELETLLKKLFKLIFPLYTIKFDVGCINFYTQESKGIVGQINPMNFDYFKGFVEILFLPQGLKDEISYNPANQQAAEIAEKLKKGNAKRREMQQEKDDGKYFLQSLFANYISILSVALGMDINILYNYTPFQLYNIFERFSLKMAYDMYQQVKTIPFADTSNVKEPENWLDNFYKV